jgi:hypothetical protein
MAMNRQNYLLSCLLLNVWVSPKRRESHTVMNLKNVATALLFISNKRHSVVKLQNDAYSKC